MLITGDIVSAATISFAACCFAVAIVLLDPLPFAAVPQDAWVSPPRLRGATPLVGDVSAKWVRPWARDPGIGEASRWSLRTVLPLRGGKASSDETASEGPQQRRPGTRKKVSWNDVITGPDNTEEGSSEFDEEDYGHVKSVLRRNALNPEQREDFFAQLHNDSQWANVTLLPLQFGPETVEEIQWEQERHHGDLNLYRRTWVPTPKYLAWKAKEDQSAAEAELARKEAIASADDMSMSSSATSDSEPNWYFENTEEGDRRLMWRPQYGAGPGAGKKYVPFTEPDGSPYNLTQHIDPGNMEEDIPEGRNSQKCSQWT